MTPFLDSLREASFRGVAFHVRERSGDGGRRGPDHQFAQRDLPEVEDTGRKQRTFTIQAFLIAGSSTDYGSDRDRLIEALEAYGPGLYVDPWGQETQVIVRQFSYRESIDHLGYVEFAVTFKEAGEERYPASSADTRAGLESAARALEAATVSAFNLAVRMAEYPSFVRERLADVAANTVRAIMQVLDLPTILATPPSKLRRSLTALEENAATALRHGTYAADLASVVRETAMVLDPSQAATAMRALTDAAALNPPPGVTPLTDQTPITSVTPSRVGLIDAQSAVLRLLERLALVAWTSSQAWVTWESWEDAQFARASITGAIDRARFSALGDARTFDDAVGQALAVAQRAVSADFKARSAGLPRLKLLTIPESWPASVAAYRLTGDSSKGADLTRRNRLFHPVFTPAAQTLEVL